MSRQTYTRKEVIETEQAWLRQRRERLFGKEAAEKLDQTRFGIALSGGGIRSATINLGFLKTLQRFDLLRKADYLSTVSGGGYTGAFIQAATRAKGSYEAVFAPERIAHMRSHGDYLIPGQKPLAKLWNTLVLVVAYVVSWIMNLSNLAIVLGIGGVAGWLLWHILGMGDPAFWQNFHAHSQPVGEIGKWALLAVLVIHFVVNIVQVYGQGISRAFNQIETGLLIGALVAWLVILLASVERLYWPDTHTLLVAGALMAGLFLLGFATNANAVGFHRYYRNQLAKAFLFDTGEWASAKLWQLGRTEREADLLAPYPLINTCLNILSLGGDKKIKGSKGNDYFLLSPLHCGSKLSRYVRTADFPGYRELTLAAATTISAAAVNPGMGNYSNPILSMLLTLFNARLGFWLNNPLNDSKTYRVWWPAYFFKEMMLKLDSGAKKINVSDGGHIENLAVYELLRRRCRLIIAVDAGADPEFHFDDLENLTIRARNELGIDIAFRPDQVPEEVIRPRPSHGYSRQRFAVADLYLLWEEFGLCTPDGQPVRLPSGKPCEVLVNYHYDAADDELTYSVALKAKAGVDADQATLERWQARAIEMVEERLSAKTALSGRDKLKVGTLVYVKSSVTAPEGKPLIIPDTEEGRIKYDTYKYKIYHPNFPHEPTSDQFFDPVQWEAYYQLGQYLAGDVLGIDLSKFPPEGFLWERTIEELIARFNPRQATPTPDTPAITRPREMGPAPLPEESVAPSPEQKVDYRM